MKKIILLLALSAAVLNAAPLKIAENGKACAGILIPADAKPVTRLAAGELADYLGKMTGAKFTVGTKSTHKVNFRIGFGDAADFQPNEYVIRTSGNNIDIYGRDSEKPFNWFEFYHHVPWQGSLRGVYEFLDLQGVRWPNPAIEYVPRKKDLTVDDLDIRRKFDFITVKDSPTWDFIVKTKDGKEYAKKIDTVYQWLLRIGFFSNRFHLYGCHSEYRLGLYKDPEWLSDPTRLMLGKDGKRNKRYSCWTHPDIVKIWIKAVDGYFSGKSTVEAGFKYIDGKPAKGISHWPFPFVCPDEFMVDPMDHTSSTDGRCRCERCNQYRKDHPCKDDTEMIWDVIIKVAEFTLKKYPDKFITTLVYPPKQQLPKRKLPPNIKVRICLAGPKVGLAAPKYFDAEMKKIEDWYKLTGNRVPLWVYHCIDFGNAMPYLVETYPRQIARYVKGIRKWSSGIYMETNAWNGCFTPINLDIYINRRMMNNPDRNVEKELKDFFKAAYGPAASEAEQFFGELERLFADFWKKTVPPDAAPGLVVPWERKGYETKYSLWTLTYTEENLQKLENLVRKMEKKTAGTIYARQVSLLRKYMFDEIVNARKQLFADEAARKKSAYTVPMVKGVPSETDWKKAPVLTLRQADRFLKTAVVPGQFRLLSDGKNLYCRAELTEPALDRSKSSHTRSGARDIWHDNTFELFFYSVADRRLTQLIFNDLGAWSALVMRRGSEEWKLLPGVTVSARKKTNSWSLDITVPIASVLPQGGELRFNATRERNIKGITPEFSTWSSLALLGEWHNYYKLPTLIIK